MNRTTRPTYSTGLRMTSPPDAWHPDSEHVTLQWYRTTEQRDQDADYLSASFPTATIERLER